MSLRRYPNPWRQAVASVLLEARRHGGYTQAELGRILGCSSQTVRRLEKGHHEAVGSVIEPWLEATGFEAEIIAGPDVDWLPGDRE